MTRTLSVVQEDGSWIVSDHGSGVYGCGNSLLHAFCDFHAALLATRTVLEGRKLSPAVERQQQVICWLLGQDAHDEMEE